MPTRAGVSEKHADLTIFNPSSRAAVLSLDSHRLVSFFEKARLINHQNSIRSRERFPNIRVQCISYPVAIPLCSIQHMLERIRGGLSHFFGYLPCIFS